MTAVIPVLLFHGKGRNGERYLLPLAPCGGTNPLRRFAPALPKGEPFALSVKPFGFASSPKGRGGCDQREQTERAHPLPCGELPPQRLRGLEMAEHKKALSEAASFFVWSPSSLGLKGASSPFLVGPARRNRWHFSGSLLVPKENNPRPAAAHRNRRALAALNTRHLLCKPVCGLKAPLGLSCPPGTAVLSGSLLSVKREHLRPAKHHPKCTLFANQKCRLFAFQRRKTAFLFFARKLCKKALTTAFPHAILNT